MFFSRARDYIGSWKVVLAAAGSKALSLGRFGDKDCVAIEFMFLKNAIQDKRNLKIFRLQCRKTVIGSFPPG
jgi:hypothetical protein